MSDKAEGRSINQNLNHPDRLESHMYEDKAVVGEIQEEKAGRLTRCAARFGGQVQFMATLLKRFQVTADRLAGSVPTSIEKQVARNGTNCVASELEQAHEDFSQLLFKMEEAAKRLETL